MDPSRNAPPQSGTGIRSRDPNPTHAPPPNVPSPTQVCKVSRSRALKRFELWDPEDYLLACGVRELAFVRATTGVGGFVSAYGAGAEGRNGAFIEMALAAGGTLDRWARVELLTMPSAVDVARAIRAVAIALFEQLARLHFAGFVHGDLKPANVLLMRPGDPSSLCLCDWTTVSCQGLSMYPRGRKLCTVGYAAPEHDLPDGAAGHTDPRRDVYSAARCIVFCLTGLHGTPRGTEGHEVRRALYGADFSDVEDIAGTLEKMLDDDPARRPTALEAAQYLRLSPAARDIPPTPSPPRMRLPGDASVGRKRRDAKREHVADAEWACAAALAGHYDEPALGEAVRRCTGLATGLFECSRLRPTARACAAVAVAALADIDVPCRYGGLRGEVERLLRDPAVRFMPEGGLRPPSTPR